MGGLDQSEELVALCLGGSILFFLSFFSELGFGRLLPIQVLRVSASTLGRRILLL